MYICWKSCYSSKQYHIIMNRLLRLLLVFAVLMSASLGLAQDTKPAKPAKKAKSTSQSSQQTEKVEKEGGNCLCDSHRCEVSR